MTKGAGGQRRFITPTRGAYFITPTSTKYLTTASQLRKILETPFLDSCNMTFLYNHG